MARHIAELKSLLANPFDAVGASQRLRSDIYLRDEVSLVLFLELAAEVGIGHRVDAF